jgi:DNA modification methylase
MQEQTENKELQILGDNRLAQIDCRVKLPYYNDELTTIFNDDCLTIMPALRPLNGVIVTDPPYGIGADKMTLGNGKNKIFRGDENWDKQRPHRCYFELMKLISRHQIIFGGNYFNDILGESRGMIFWDKGTGDNDYADGELAWTSYDKVIKKYDLSWVGANAKDRFSKREHPTQKPLELLIEIIRDYTTPADIIIDPFMGSGTTLVAAATLGRKAVGIEINPKYCDIAVKRLQTIQTRMMV